MTPLRIAAYLSGHGFGHATRVCAVLKELRAQTSLQIHLRTAAPRHVFDYYLGAPFDWSPVATDVGAIERDILSVDIPATAAAWDAFLPREESIIASESAWLRDAQIHGVLFDTPALAAEIAARARVPAVAMGNFTWDFIYQPYAPDFPALAEANRRIRRRYALAPLMLRLPLHHAMDQFPRIADIPLVAAKSPFTRAQVRAELGIPESEPCILVALRGEQLPALARARGATLLSFGELAGSRVLGPEWQRRFTDVLVASDAVLSKPGYGVVAECLANNRPLLHLPRTGFRESAVLIEWMDRLMPHRQMTAEEIGALDLSDIVAALPTTGDRPPTTAINGAEVAAQHILRHLEERHA